MKVGAAIDEAYGAERDLAAALIEAGQRHRADHDVFHMGRTLAGWCDRHLRVLAEEGRRYGLELDPDAREAGAALAGRHPEPGLLLLRDLRDLHLAAARASLAWTVLGQGAQAVGDERLLAAVTSCHPEAIRTMKWTVQRIKEASPQVLAS